MATPRELGDQLQAQVGDVWENLDDTGKMPTRKRLEELLTVALHVAEELQTMSPPKWRWLFRRSSITGRFVTQDEAMAHPDTTITEQR